MTAKRDEIGPRSNICGPELYGKSIVLSSSSSWAKQVRLLLEAANCSVRLARGTGDQSDVLRSSEWLLAFKSDRIWTTEELSLPLCGALNVHLAPPWHRGLGGYETAIYEDWPVYGVTVHHMVEQIDYGPIVLVHTFPVPTGATSRTLAATAAKEGLAVLANLLIVQAVSADRQPWRWSGPLHTRAYLRELLRDNPKLERSTV